MSQKSCYFHYNMRKYNTQKFLPKPEPPYSVEYTPCTLFLKPVKITLTLERKYLQKQPATCPKETTIIPGQKRGHFVVFTKKKKKKVTS